MPSPKKPKPAGTTTKKPIEQYEHRDKQRVNNPPVGLVTPETDLEVGAKAYAYDPHLSRPGSCVVLAGESPVAVSAGAPRSRVRAGGEIRRPERTVESLPEAAGPLGRRQRRGPSIKRTLQPREMGPRKGGMAEPIMSRRRQQTASARAGGMQDVPGVRRRARVERTTRNRRDPTWRLTSSEGLPYKPSAKGAGAGRESEGVVVPLRMETRTPSEGRAPALVVLAHGGKCEGMDR